MLSKGRCCDWWDMNYFGWFSSWSPAAIFESDLQANPWKTDTYYPFIQEKMRDKISQFGMDSFTKDCGGNGRTFLPGLFCMTWYAQTHRLASYEQLKGQFEQETLLSFDVCLFSVYQPER